MPNDNNMLHGFSVDYSQKNEEKLYIPAKDKSNIYSLEHVFRTCAYCRVSTDSEMQATSFEIQKLHYEQLVGNHPNWQLQHIYADEGITATSMKHRDQFNQMIAACEAGEYDLIVTKSVSRFARNVLDCISLARKFKAHNPPIGIFFETDNLFTLSEDSEFRLAMLATFAQEESTKKRESQIWSHRERTKNGQLLVPELLGYSREKDQNGRYIKGSKLQIVEEEAEIVRFIYDSFLAGSPLHAIAEILSDLNIPTKIGNLEWSEGSLRYILSNERYCGKVLTWKSFTVDMFEHKKRRNNNDFDQYLYANDHEPIISVSKFEAVQTLLENRKHGVQCYPIMHVIDGGIFKGYVPVNHHWINDNPNLYFEASNSITQNSSQHKFRCDYFSAFNLEGYQVVRGQFLTRKVECPSITIGNQRISFNVECIRKFADVSYVQLLIHPTERKIAIRPCEGTDIHSIRWRVDAEKPMTSKTISCPYFIQALFQIMTWVPDYNYHVRGTWIKKDNEQIIIFDLTKAVSSVWIEEACEEAEKCTRKRVEMCPEEWDRNFGEEFYEFCTQNIFYYAKADSDWNSQKKSRAVPNSSQVSILSADELNANLEKIKSRQEI